MTLAPLLSSSFAPPPAPTTRTNTSTNQPAPAPAPTSTPRKTPIPTTKRPPSTPSPSPSPSPSSVIRHSGSGSWNDGQHTIERDTLSRSDPAASTDPASPVPMLDTDRSFNGDELLLVESVPSAPSRSSSTQDHPEHTEVERIVIEHPSTQTNRMYDAVLGVGISATVIIVVLLIMLHRNRRRNAAALAKDDYPEDEDDPEPVCQNARTLQMTSEDLDEASGVTQLSNVTVDTSNHPYRALDKSVDTSSSSSSSNSSKRLNSKSSSLRRMQSSFREAFSTSSHSSASNSSTHALVSTRGISNTQLGVIWNDPVILAARIPFDQIKCKESLSSGGFGEVFVGVWKDQQVAVKRPLPEMRRQMIYLEDFLDEVKLMASLQHERIVTLLGVAWDAPKDLCIVTEYMDRGDLRNVLNQWHSTNTSRTGWNAQKLQIALHIAQALAYLHTITPKKIIHRDLKSRNVLLNHAWEAKLSDFGISREQSTERTMTGGHIGSSMWIAPEVMMGKNYDEKADIFSFGIVLTELDTHLLPYHNVTTPDGRKIPQAAILHMVMMGKLQAKFSPMSRTDMVLLGRSCLSLDPSTRPSAAQILLKIQKVLQSI